MAKGIILVSIIFNSITSIIFLLLNIWALSNSFEETFIFLALIFGLLVIGGNLLLIIRIGKKKLIKNRNSALMYGMILIILINMLVCFGIINKTVQLPENNSKLENFNNPEGARTNEYERQRNNTINSYLLTQKTLTWKTKQDSTNLCVFEVLDKTQQLFPLPLWIRCGEFVLQNGDIKELSGVSIPILLNYPNELSYFDPKRFSYKIPSDGAIYTQDIKNIFSKEIHSTIYNYDATGLTKKLEALARIKLQK